MGSVVTALQDPMQADRLRTLQAVGVFCGFAGGTGWAELRRRSKLSALGSLPSQFRSLW